MCMSTCKWFIASIYIYVTQSFFVLVAKAKLAAQKTTENLER